MLGISGSPTKKDLKTKLGTAPRFIETSVFGLEYQGKDGNYTVVGPSPYVRKWYATVTVQDGKIVRVT